MNESAPPARTPRRAGEVFRVFLLLGLTSFGGPIAHLGYFRTEVVQRRAWLTDADYADLVALCQFLPGPASSQVGFAIGLHRAGIRGALAAFVAFTAPSAALMIAFGFGASLFGGSVGAGVIAGLKVVAVAVIAQAVLAMSRTLTPDPRRAGIAAVAAVTALLLPGSAGQVIAIAFGALSGWVLCRTPIVQTSSRLQIPLRRAVGVTALALFAILLVIPPAVAAIPGFDDLAFFDAFYRSGALVFGGGHVVLPLLHGAVVDTGWVSEGDFLSGYGAAQAMPGPLFTFAGYLGTVAGTGPGGALGGVLAVLAIFLPGLLLLVGVLPFWHSLRSRPLAQALMRGANAAVVGVLAAALYSPVFTSAITGVPEFCLAVVCFVLLVGWRLPPWAAVIAGGVGGVIIARAG